MGREDQLQSVFSFLWRFLASLVWVRPVAGNFINWLNWIGFIFDNCSPLSYKNNLWNLWNYETLFKLLDWISPVVQLQGGSREMFLEVDEVDLDLDIDLDLDLEVDDCFWVACNLQQQQHNSIQWLLFFQIHPWCGCTVCCHFFLLLIAVCSAAQDNNFPL